MLAIQRGAKIKHLVNKINRNSGGVKERNMMSQNLEPSILFLALLC